ncbi:MAG: zinc ribbon domain-containing protein [Candidatus Limnocylindria bacterium]
MSDDEREPREDRPPAPREAEAWVVPPEPTDAPPAVSAHSVPATPLGEGIRCPRCSADNRPGIAFCRNCGQRLATAGAPVTVERPTDAEGTLACPRCATHNRAGAAFCQSCGANLRAVPSTDAPAPDAPAPDAPAAPGRAILGPVVLLLGAVGILTGWLLPFAYGGGSLWDRSFGDPGGYGIGFWAGYSAVAGGFLDKVYFGLAGPAPLLVILLIGLAAAGLWRAAPSAAQRIVLLVTLAWGAGLALLFGVVELFGGPGGGLIEILRALSPAGVIFLLSGLIVAIGSLTRLARA